MGGPRLKYTLSVKESFKPEFQLVYVRASGNVKTFGLTSASF